VRVRPTLPLARGLAALSGGGGHERILFLRDSPRRVEGAAAAAAAAAKPEGVARLGGRRSGDECQPASRGLHSSTFQLNLSALHGIGGVRKGLCSPW
jgi:hypothetical protein